MLAQQSALVLRSLRYGDSSHIVKAFTAQEGLMSFIAGTARRSRSALRPAALQPFSLVDLVYYAKGRGELRRLKEIRPLYNYQNLPYEPVKSSLALFLAELLSHLLHEGEDRPRLFPFLQGALIALDQHQGSLASFPLLFMSELSALLGLAPEPAPAQAAHYFDLAAGQYMSELPPHPHYLQGAVLEAWRQNAQASLSAWEELQLPANLRRQCLEAWLIYFRLHVHDFGELKSLAVLRDLWH